MGNQEAIAIESAVPLGRLAIFQQVVLFAMQGCPRLTLVLNVAVAFIINNVCIATFCDGLHVVDGAVFRQFDGLTPPDVAQFIGRE